MSLLNAVRIFCSQFNEYAGVTAEHNTFWIAYSGGLDSHVLLSLCSQLRKEMKLMRAIHVNHGISPNANSWANHCKKICESYDIQFIERTISLDLKAGDSLEEAARNKRYAVFAEYLEEGDVLLTAHHQDDQAETVLLQLLRGAGLKGLSAMPEIKSFARGHHGRPLLAFAREDLLQYAKEHQLIWIEDESNQDASLSRNFIRHEILAKLTLRWPSAAACIARSASHCAENQMLLEAFSREVNVQGSRENTLSVARLLQFSPEKQRFFLRSWIHQLKYPLPDSKKMETIQRDVLFAAWDSSPLVKWGDVMLRRHRMIYICYLFAASLIHIRHLPGTWKKR